MHVDLLSDTDSKREANNPANHKTKQNKKTPSKRGGSLNPGSLFLKGEHVYWNSAYPSNSIKLLLFSN